MLAVRSSTLPEALLKTVALALAAQRPDVGPAGVLLTRSATDAPAASLRGAHGKHEVEGSNPSGSTNVVKSTTFFLHMTVVCCPVAYPVARDSITVLTGPSVAAGVAAE